MVFVHNTIIWCTIVAASFARGVFLSLLDKDVNFFARSQWMGVSVLLAKVVPASFFSVKTELMINMSDTMQIDSDVRRKSSLNNFSQIFLMSK